MGAVVSSTASSVELERLLSLWLQNYASSPTCAKFKYLAYVRSFVKTGVWHTAFSSAWNCMEHITGLEAEAYVLALQWIASHNVTGQRIIFLSDSRVVIGAMAKGRSSSPFLSLRYRRVAALRMAHVIEAYLVYVPIDINPTDEPPPSELVTRSHEISSESRRG